MDDAKKSHSGEKRPSPIIIATPDVQQAVETSVPVSPTMKPKRQATLLPSVFEGRPPVLLFSYTVACGAVQRPMDRAVLADIDGPRIFYSHTDAVHEYNAVLNILRQGGLYRVRPDSQRWLLLWSTHPTGETLRSLKPMQKTNHFPGSWHLGRKDLLWRNVARMQKKFGKEYQITPQGYILPKAYVAWESARVRQPSAVWIWKPCSQSCGRGIRVFSSSITSEEAKELGKKRGIIQRYVPNPLLIDGYKFDLRIYVLVLSYDPLKIYINDEGLVRLATEKYSADTDTLDSRMMHLTNYSVNKSSPAFVQNKDNRDKADVDEEEEEEEVDDEARPSKWSLSELRLHFERNSLDYKAVHSGIKDVVIKTLLAAEPPLQAEWCKLLEKEDSEGWAAQGPSGANRSSCFELYGFDVLVDRDLKTWLLEVNICPSLSSGSPLDKRIKTKLVADIFTIVGIRPPAAMWKRSRGSINRPSSDIIGLDDADFNISRPCTLTPTDLAKRKAKIAACQNPTDALAFFDESAWEMVLESHDQDMRCGGLERIFPTSTSKQYLEYLEQESYWNLVLRRWQEAGGGENFRRNGARSLVPPWVPQQVCFSPT